MIHNNLFRFNVVSTAAFVIFSIFSSQVKADFYVINDALQCAKNGEYINSQELADEIALLRLPTKFGIACFDYSIDEASEKILLIYQSAQDGAVINEKDFSNKIDNKVRAFFVSRAISFEHKKPIQIKKVGEIFPKSLPLREKESITQEEFLDLINNKNPSFSKLIQANLKRRSDENNKSCIGNLKPHQGFYEGGIDGGFGKNSEKALEKFIGFCKETEITADMITGTLLPQLFAFAEEPAEGSDVNRPPEQNPLPDEKDIEQALKESLAGEPSGAEIENEIVELEQKLKEARSKISSLEQEKSDLQKANNDVVAQKNRSEQVLLDRSKKTILELWDQLEITVLGEFPTGEQIPFSQRAVQREHCNIPIENTLLQSAITVHKQSPYISCLKYSFEDADVDETQRPSWNETTNEIVFALWPKRVEIITSVTTDAIERLTEDNVPECGVTLTFVDEEMTEVLSLPDSGVDGARLYASWDSETKQAILTDSKTIRGRKLVYETLAVKLSSSDSNNQKCAVSSANPVSIELKEYVHNGEPQALIDRDGNLVLHNFSIAAAKGATLVVFFDTNVGMDGQDEFAFNQSLNNTKIAARQKIYFAGFAEALGKYLQDQSKFENIVIYQSIGAEEALASASQSNFKKILQKANLKDPLSVTEIEQVLDRFEDEFVAGQKGSFSNKNKMIRPILAENSLVSFLSFGASGFDDSKACDTEKRPPHASSFMIVDIWDRNTLDSLLSTGKAEILQEKIIFKCTGNDKLYGFKDSPSVTSKVEISAALLTYLEKYLEY